MKLDYYTRGEVKTTMYNYIRDIITGFKQYDLSNKNAHAPAANHLLKVQDDQKKLTETLAQVFHTFTVRALFATKQARPDIHTAVARSIRQSRLYPTLRLPKADIRKRDSELSPDS